MCFGGGTILLGATVNYFLPGVGNYFYATGIGGMIVGAADASSDRLVRAAASGLYTYVKGELSQFASWIGSLWQRFDSACATSFGAAWTNLPKVIRIFIVCTGAATCIGIAVAGCKMLTKMFADVLESAEISIPGFKIHAHADSPFETSVIAAMCAAFLLAGTSTDSAKTFALFNTMYRSLSIASQGILEALPIRESINALCESLDITGPFTIIKIQKEITDFQNDSAAILDDPSFTKNIRSDITMPAQLKALKEKGKELKETISFSRSVSSTTKTELFRTIARLCKAHTDCVSVSDRYAKRPLPVWLDFRGEPGGGKTDVSNLATRCVFKRIHNRDMVATDYYPKTPGSPYWSAYSPDSCWATFMDEFLTSTMVQVNQPEASAILNMVGTEYCPLDMPDVESKGVTAFRSSVLVTTGNGGFDLTGLTKPDALRRRIAFPMTSTIKNMLPAVASKDDFNGAWIIELNADYYANPTAYKGINKEILAAVTRAEAQGDPRPQWSFEEFVDIMERAVRSADSSQTMYERYVNAQASRPDILRVTCAKVGHVGIIDYYTVEGCFRIQIQGNSWHHVILADDEDLGNLKEAPSFFDALAYVTGRSLRNVTVKHDTVKDFSVLSDGISTYFTDFCVTSPSGYLTAYDVLTGDMFNTPAVSRGFRVSLGNGLVGVDTLVGLYLDNPDLELYKVIHDGHTYYDLGNESKIHTFFKKIKQPKGIYATTRDFVVDNAFPIAIATGLFIGAASLISSVVSLYTGVDVDAQSGGKQIKNRIYSMKKPSTLPRFTEPPLVTPHGAAVDALSLFPNIRQIECSGSGMKCWGIFVTDSIMITVAHLIRNKGLLHIYDTTAETYSTFGESDYESNRVEDSDFGVVYFRRPHAGIKNILKRFCRSLTPVNATVKRMSVSTGKHPACMFTRECSTMETPGVSYLVKSGVKLYPISNYVLVDEPTGKVGDCGLPYLRLENGCERIAGIHFGGSGTMACMHPVSMDMLTFYIGLNPFKILTMDTNPIEVHAEIREDTLTRTGVTCVGSLTCKPSFCPRGKTRRSALARIEIPELPPFPDCVDEVAPATCCGPVAMAAVDFSRKGRYQSSPIMDKILQTNLLTSIYSIPSLHAKPMPHPDSVELSDIILGKPGVVHGLSDTTSIGPLFNRDLHPVKANKKRDLWNTEHRYVNPEFLALCEERIAKASQGIIVPMVVEGQFKDEVRNVAAKRIEVDGITGIKPREFYVADPVDLIETKSLFWPLLKLMHDTPIVSQCGINPWSIEWTVLMQDVERRPYMMYTDVKSFDKTLNGYAFQNMLEEVVIMMYAQFNDESLNNRVRVQIAKLFDYFYICHDQLYTIAGSNPSGNILTVWLNDNANYFYLKAAFLYLQQSHLNAMDMDFEDHVTVKTNGDDNVVSVSADVAPWFNIKSYAGVVHHFFGLIVTDLDKVPVHDNPNATPFYTKEGANFLSRGFKKASGGKYLAPLNLASIWSSVYWSKTEPTDKIERVAHYAQIIEGALRELALHGESEFNNFVGVVRPRFIRIGGTWLPQWQYKQYRHYMEMYTRATDIKKVPTPIGWIQAQGSDMTELAADPPFVQEPPSAQVAQRPVFAGVMPRIRRPRPVLSFLQTIYMISATLFFNANMVRYGFYFELITLLLVSALTYVRVYGNLRGIQAYIFIGALMLGGPPLVMNVAYQVYCLCVGHIPGMVVGMVNILRVVVFFCSMATTIII
jgi:hypothetical protein